MARWMRVAAVGAGLWGLWALLWRDSHWPVWLGGAGFVIGLSVLVACGKLPLGFPRSAWLRWDLWLAFAALMAYRIARAVAVTSWTVLTGQAQPGIVTVPVRLKSEVGQLLLLWAITVTPGTIALLVEGDTVHVHCLHRPASGDLPDLARIASILERLWG